MATLGASDHQDPSLSSSPSPHSAHPSASSNDPSALNSNASSLMPPDPNRSRSSSSSKALLTRALSEAQAAVQLDNAYDIPAALDAYQRAVDLLSQVMEASTSADEQERLRIIHDSYLFRIHLLSSPPTPAPIESSVPSDEGALLSPTHLPLQQQQMALSFLPQSPPPRQPLPQPPSRQLDQIRSPGSSALASTAPASSSNIIAPLQPKGHVSENVQGATPPSRRAKKHIPAPLQPSSYGILPPPEPKTPRLRSDSTSVNDHGNVASPGHTRHHVRSHTGGSAHRVTGDIVSAAEQLQAQSQQRMHRVKSREHLGIPMNSAPTTPLPPTPTALGPPPSSPPPVPTPAPGSVSVSSSSISPPSIPPIPSLGANQTSLASLGPQPLTSQSPRAPPPSQTPVSLVSPPASPANAIRRGSPLAAPPTSSSLGQQLNQNQNQQQQQLSSPAPPPSQAAPASQKSFLSTPENSPEENTNDVDHGRFSEENPVTDDWLPDLSSKSLSATEESLDHASEDPYPRDKALLKGLNIENHSEQSQPQVAQTGSTEQEGQKLVESTPTAPVQQPQPQQQQQISQHQRSASQSSALSAHQPVVSQSSRSPLSGPMYSFQAGASSISSLHALDNPSYKRISDSARSIKEGSSLARSSGASVTTNGPAPVGSPSSQSSASSPQPTRPDMLRHHSSFSKLGGSNSTSPTLDKPWSPSMSGANQPTLGGSTLFDVIAEDPFAGMGFPLPPPFVEPPPVDPYMRCFWLIRKLEQTMTTGGFLTKRMYVPRAIWYQSLVRLPAADTKMSACQSLTTLLNKMTTQSQKGHLNLLVDSGGGSEGDADRKAILKELEALETAALQVQVKLSKKLSFIHRPGKSGTPLTIATNQGYTEDLQGPVTSGTASIYGAASIYNGNGSFDWLGNDEPPMPTSSGNTAQEKAKKGGVSVGGSAPDAGGLKSQWKSFSKSVQKSIGNDKVEDTSSYTESVVKLFQASYILESMLRHYNALSPFQTHIQIVNRLRRLCDVLNLVICAFVVRDLGELMGKYVKRVGAWVAD
ncbi:hypothetical protein BGZ51_004888 [Haplosporangium sp. Z 767]|nr:hypothetical protein BGZ51_004888 [Haplosporangium sp. Z 767]